VSQVAFSGCKSQLMCKERARRDVKLCDNNNKAQPVLRDQGVRAQGSGTLILQTLPPSIIWCRLLLEGGSVCYWGKPRSSWQLGHEGLPERAMDCFHLRDHRGQMQIRLGLKRILILQNYYRFHLKDNWLHSGLLLIFGPESQTFLFIFENIPKSHWPKYLVH
jgi:hypothetical protein